MTKQELIVFKDGELELAVNVSPEKETVWLTRQQLAELFDRDIKTIGKHINNIFTENELDKFSTVAKFATVQKEQDRHTGKVRDVERNILHYSLDVIISVGYRVKSKRGVAFRKWANSVLKEYTIKGYAINHKKLNIPNYSEIINILDTYRKFDGDLNLTSNDLLGFLVAYEKGLKILDDYDHQTIEIVNGQKDSIRLNYDECINIIRLSSFKDKGDYFAVERDDSFKASISTIYQTFDGVELYPSLELKASNLLYFITKNHSFIDGNKRIAAIIFLYFLEKNNALYYNQRLRISNETLATLTILIASSNPKDQDIIVNLINLLIS